MERKTYLKELQNNNRKDPMILRNQIKDDSNLIYSEETVFIKQNRDIDSEMESEMEEALKNAECKEGGIDA